MAGWLTGRRQNAGILVWVIILAGTSVGECQEDAQSLFDSVYNTRIQAVRATGNREDDVALAREMLDAARSAQGSAARPLAALLCEQAYELAKRTPEGLDTAVGAMKLLASDDSPERVQALNQIAMLRQRQYGLARGAERTQAGEILISALLNAGRAEQESGRAEAASALYRRALGAAQAVKSSRAGLVRAMIDNLRVARQRDEKIARLKQQLKANPEDKTAGAELLRIHLVELDDPSAARRYTFLTDDERWKTNVPLAARPAEELSAAQALQLAEWYRGLAMSAPKTAQAAMYRRAQAYLNQFLEAADTADGDRLKVGLYLRGIDSALAKLSETAGPAVTSTRQAGELVAWGNFQDGTPIALPAQRRGFVAVAAQGGRWIALRADGRVVGSVVEGRHKVPDDLKKVQAISCGKWADVALHTDGTVTVWGQEFHEQAAPKDLKDVKSVSAGHGIFLALKRDGTVVAWENAANFTSTDAAMDIASIAASSGKGYVLKRDGQVLGRHHGGNVPGRPQDLPRIVKIASGPGSGCLMLARSGQVFQWGGHMLGGPIPKARQIRAGGGLYAIQKAGREWMIWGADPRGIELNREVVKMGPLKDLAFSSGVHTHRGYFIGIR